MALVPPMPLKSVKVVIINKLVVEIYMSWI